MESQCGETLRKPSVVSEDRISELPEALLLHILSYLPTKIVLATSLLSKRWKLLWKFVPKLMFESDQNTQKFSENVGRFLLSHQAPVLESFHLKLCHDCQDIDIGIWAGIAFGRNVREFVLELLCHDRISFPSSLFSFNTLETLKLKYAVLMDVPSPVCMKSLRTLHLYCVIFENSEIMNNLVSGCPNLETLIFRGRYSYKRLPNFMIGGPSLKRLSIKDSSPDYLEVEGGGYVIDAPLLNYLSIEELSHSSFFLIENAPMLVEANIRDVSYLDNENILVSLNSAKRLSLDLSPIEIKFPRGTIFDQLVYLEMYTRKVEWWNLLALMLDSSPNLQVLHLIDQSKNHDKGVASRKWNEPENVPECLLSCLETFVWTLFSWDREEEMELATYILRNARCLKNAKFSTRTIYYTHLSKMEDRYKMLMELEGVAKASNSCNLVFEE